MQVPTEIKNSIMKMSKLYADATILNEQVRSWMEENNCYNDTVIDQLIDRVEQGIGDGKGFVKFLEKYNNNEGNDDSIY
ncbi:hypothetical protein [Brevibacillus sp. NRS-1366]|uniref:hypothetical protein n=1 Tax=Brevibacillus sp. NRS-1366 TaxID=3233899 RepID=UPI003D2015AC